jgi:hypothetical protein
MLRIPSFQAAFPAAMSTYFAVAPPISPVFHQLSVAFPLLGVQEVGSSNLLAPTLVLMRKQT